jgi:predicted DNA-binding protein (UPF0251 family)
MSRPVKRRRIAFIPGVTYFKPEGIPLRCLEGVRLTLEEAEAMRLKELEGLEQEQGALKMNISRQTFQRMLSSAHQKMADAILNGKAIMIEGGHFEVAPGKFRCGNGHEWEEPFESMVKMPPRCCPVCRTPNIEQIWPAKRNCTLKGRSRCCLKCSLSANIGESLISATVKK